MVWVQLPNRKSCSEHSETSFATQRSWPRSRSGWHCSPTMTTTRTGRAVTTGSWTWGASPRRSPASSCRDRTTSQTTELALCSLSKSLYKFYKVNWPLCLFMVANKFELFAILIGYLNISAPTPKTTLAITTTMSRAAATTTTRISTTKSHNTWSCSGNPMPSHDQLDQVSIQ